MNTFARRTAVIAALALAATPVAAHASSAKKPKKHVRTVSVAYTGPCSVDGWTPVATGPEASFCPNAPVALTVQPTEHYFSAAIKDATGQAVPIALVTTGVNTSGGINQVFCGSVKDFPIAAGTYNVMPAIAVGDASCPVPATQGTITVHLSNLK
jgi:hypothetical protein